ncbi:MAG: hypothetical protein Q7U16_12600 [Agitococcus sp.]|nr:hypothetical protein [Agitococcus sp.]
MNHSTVADRYYLEDSRGHVGHNVQFWSKDGKGYTTDISKAQVYSKKEAMSQHDCRESDIPWPTTYMDAKKRLVVDCQYVRQAEASFDEAYYLQDNRIWEGNDIAFLTNVPGTCSEVVAHAQVYSKEDAERLQQITSYLVAWPKTYIDQKTRPTVDFRTVSKKQALAGTGIVLKKPQPLRSPAYRCGGCGVFMTQINYYSCACPRCDTLNRS